MTTEITLPIDTDVAVILEVLAHELDEVADGYLDELEALDARRALFGLMREARRIQAGFDEDAKYLAMIRDEIDRKNEGKKRSLAYLEANVARIAETLLVAGSKHTDVPGVGRVQYRDYAESLTIEDAEAFMAALGPDERVLMVEDRPHLRTTEAKKYQKAVLEQDGGALLPGVVTVPARRVPTIEYDRSLT